MSNSTVFLSNFKSNYMVPIFGGISGGKMSGIGMPSKNVKKKLKIMPHDFNQKSFWKLPKHLKYLKIHLKRFKIPLETFYNTRMPGLL